MDRLDAMTILLALCRQPPPPDSLGDGQSSGCGAGRALECPLLHRGHRKVVLTDAGRSYVDSCRRIMEEIAEVERTASGEYRAPQRELIITAPAVLGRRHVLPVVAEFQRAFSDIWIRLQLMDRYVNLVEEHVDVAVRVGELADSSMIVTRLGLIRRIQPAHALAAAPRRLKPIKSPATHPANHQRPEAAVFESRLPA